MSHQEISGAVNKAICKKISNKRSKKFVEKTNMKGEKNYNELISNRIPKDRHNERFQIQMRLSEKLMKRTLGMNNTNKAAFDIL